MLIEILLKLLMMIGGIITIIGSFTFFLMLKSEPDEESSRAWKKELIAGLVCICISQFAKHIK